MEWLYNLNITRLITWLLPPVLRSDFRIAWLTALTSPVANIYQEFSRYRQDVNYSLVITPQVWALEKAANDVFDPSQRRIYISDTYDFFSYAYPQRCC
ncbi:MAG: hypothetical protein HC896_12840 [Bacteroidales bacterium]|nr:hypothetical protein [Bacteroidales bacterium]